MKDILAQIVISKKAEIEQQKKLISLEELKEKCQQSVYPIRSMSGELAKSTTGIIAEFKRKSPSKGWIFPDARIEDVLPAYENSGASACSVLTDFDFFGGTLSDLAQARKLVNLPLIRKEFILDPYQLYEAKTVGADAILLIAAILDRELCYELAKEAHALQLEVLLEIHREEELGHVNPYIDMIGVNNRNLGTFSTSLEHSFQLSKALKKLNTSAVLISESGISKAETVNELRAHGFRGFLIGETFMKNHSPGEALAQFIGGIKNAD